MAAPPPLGGRLMKPVLLLLVLASALSGATWHVIAGGLGGDADYETRFRSLAADMQKLAAGEGVHVTALSGPEATKTALKAAIDRAATQAGPDDLFVLTLIGHGTWDQVEYKFNVPGPDVTATELAS